MLFTPALSPCLPSSFSSSMNWRKQKLAGSRQCQRVRLQVCVYVERICQLASNPQPMGGKEGFFGVLFCFPLLLLLLWGRDQQSVINSSAMASLLLDWIIYTHEVLKDCLQCRIQAKGQIPKKSAFYYVCAYCVVLIGWRCPAVVCFVRFRTDLSTALLSRASIPS